MEQKPIIFLEEVNRKALNYLDKEEQEALQSVLNKLGYISSLKLLKKMYSVEIDNSNSSLISASDLLQSSVLQKIKNLDNNILSKDEGEIFYRFIQAVNVENINLISSILDGNKFTKLTDNLVDMLSDYNHVNSSSELDKQIDFINNKKVFVSLKQDNGVGNIQSNSEKIGIPLLTFTKSISKLDDIAKKLLELEYIENKEVFISHFICVDHSPTTLKNIEPIIWKGDDNPLSHLFICMIKLGYLDKRHESRPFAQIRNHFCHANNTEYDNKVLSKKYTEIGEDINCKKDPLNNHKCARTINPIRGLFLDL